MIVIVRKDGASVTPEALIAHCRRRIGGRKTPRSHEFRSEPPPATAVGKVSQERLE